MRRFVLTLGCHCLEGALKMSERNFPKPIQLFTGEEVAQILRISRAYAYRMMQRGDIPTIRLGRRVLVTQTSLLEFIQENSKYAHLQ
jgi:excisionase family DNA binding protein